MFSISPETKNGKELSNFSFWDIFHFGGSNQRGNADWLFSGSRPAPPFRATFNPGHPPDQNSPLFFLNSRFHPWHFNHEVGSLTYSHHLWRISDLEIIKYSLITWKKMKNPNNIKSISNIEFLISKKYQVGKKQTAKAKTTF